MDVFQKFVLYSAIILLILTLVVIGIALYYAKKKQTWPPIVAECPDYWLSVGPDASGNVGGCVNIKNLGTCPATSGQPHLVMDFSNPTYTGSQGECNKYKWATRCGISWDGVTYGVSNPCQS